MADEERKMYNFPGNARSDVWKHFGFYAVDDNAESIQLDRSKAICKICHLAIKNHGNTTNLYNHVTKRHGRELASELQTKMFGDHRFQCVPSSTLDTDENDYNKSKTITNALLEYIISDCVPTSSIQTKAFRKLLFRLDPKCEIPDDNFSTTRISKIYRETKQQILSEVRQNTNGGSMAIEVWSSLSSTWISLCLHYIDNMWKMKAYQLKSLQIDDNLDNKNLNEIIENCVSEWNTCPPVSVVGNGDFYNNHTDLSWHFIPCLAQTINNAALKGFEIPDVKKLIDKGRNLIRYLENHASSLPMIDDDIVTVDTSKWLSIYEMFQWLSTNTAVIEDNLCGTHTKTQSLKLLFTSEDQILTENLLSAFKEMKTATSIVCEESKPLVSMILPVLQKLLTSFTVNQSDNIIISSIKSTVYNQLSSTYKHENINLYLIGSSLLDPRYKELPLVSKEQRNQAKEIIFSAALINGRSMAVPSDISSNSPTTTILEPSPKKLKVESEPTTSTLDDWFSDVVCQQGRKEHTELDRIKTEFNKFQFTDRVSAKSDPLLWWRKHEIIFPLLSNIAKRFLCTPATSIPANRVLTCSGQEQEASRNRLPSKEVEQLVFLNKNYKRSIDI
ncbi:hypothetical protein SNE40_004547 [Patella caerulea]|uniref:BED-type domain-containing protein n=1 Tax=Patella caerulea TaxID=87958 RepID=A0AAN8K912_PATCE